MADYTPSYRVCYSTGKRAYLSRQHARAANRHNPHRLRAYLCPECQRWHVAKREA